MLKPREALFQLGYGSGLRGLKKDLLWKFSSLSNFPDLLRAL